MIFPFEAAITTHVWPKILRFYVMTGDKRIFPEFQQMGISLHDNADAISLCLAFIAFILGHGLPRFIFT